MFRPHIINSDNGYVRTGIPAPTDIKQPFYIYAFGRTFAETRVEYKGSHSICNIICTEKGCGRVFINDTWILVPEGAAIYYPTSKKHVLYEPVDDSPWSTVFFTFAGQYADSMMELDTCVIRGDLSFISKAVDMLNEKYLTDEWPEYSSAILAFCLQRLGRITKEQNLKLSWGSDTHNKLLASIKYLTNHVNNDISLAFLAYSCNITEQHYCRIFKAYTGTTPTAYITSLRIARACDDLTKEPCRKIEEIAMECGFRSVTYFNKTFKKAMGISPTAYRKSKNL